MKRAYREWMKNRISSYRKQKVLYQDDMAAKLRLPRSTYAAYEEGRAIPSVFTLKRFCDLCGTTIDEFMEGAPELSTL